MNATYLAPVHVRLIPGSHREPLQSQLRELLLDVVRSIAFCMSSAESFEQHMANCHRMRCKTRQADRGGAAQEALGVLPEEMPCYVFDSKPGDVLAFTAPMFHASFGGAAGRRQGVMVYYEDPLEDNITAEAVVTQVIPPTPPPPPPPPPSTSTIHTHKHALSLNAHPEWADVKFWPATDEGKSWHIRKKGPTNVSGVLAPARGRQPPPRHVARSYGPLRHPRDPGRLGRHQHGTIVVHGSVGGRVGFQKICACFLRIARAQY